MADHKLSAEQAVLDTSTPSKLGDSSIKEDVHQSVELVLQTAASDEAKEKGGTVTPAVTTEKGPADTDTEVVEDDGAHYVHGAARIALVFGLCIVGFLVGLDNLIIATASFSIFESVRPGSK